MIMIYLRFSYDFMADYAAARSPARLAAMWTTTGAFTVWVLSMAQTSASPMKNP